MTERSIWQELRRFTSARLGLGRTGASLPTDALLDFQTAHASARDAVHAQVEWDAIEKALRLQGRATLRVSSMADSRATYLRRPDLGRRLDEASRAQLIAQRTTVPPEMVWVLGDGLSAAAVNRHGAAFFAEAMPLFGAASPGPIILAHHARVALADEIGELFNARLVVIAIGERPGLSSPDSLGLYVTFAPKVGRTDAERNCLSNIHQAGLSYATAARKLHALIVQARALGCTGTAIKDETDADGLPRLSAAGQ